METFPRPATAMARRDIFDRLAQYKMDRGIPTWEQALESLIATGDPAEGLMKPRTEEEVVVEGSVPS